jgi:hypothetical protein
MYNENHKNLENGYNCSFKRHIADFCGLANRPNHFQKADNGGGKNRAKQDVAGKGRI